MVLQLAVSAQESSAQVQAHAKTVGPENGVLGLEAGGKAPVTWSPAPPGGSAKEHSLEKHLRRNVPGYSTSVWLK